MEKSTKDKILDAALDLMATSGYSGASMRKIASKVGIRESAIYNHFKNKEAIFEEIVRKLFVTAFDDFFKNHPPQIEAIKGKKYLKEFVAAYKLVAFDPKHEKLFRIILIETMHNQKVRKLFLDRFFSRDIKDLSMAFFFMMQHSLIRQEDPHLLAYEFLAPLFSLRLELTLLRMEHEGTTALSTKFERHVDFFWEGIAISSPQA